jgi:hypothetical protein
MDFLQAPHYQLIKILFERSLAFLYFIAFLSAFNQFPALLGEKGFLPAPKFLKRITFQQAPSLFHWKYSDSLFRSLCVLEMGISLGLTVGLSAMVPIWLHVVLWLVLYGGYISIVSVGQDFYGFGWESMILEAGFFMAFMGPEWVTPNWIPILILRWMLFRTELGAGLIKLRGDPCWRDFTCLYFHHETQPLPNPLSRLFHHSPKSVHRFGVGFSHFVQLVVPFFIFAPQPVAGIAGALIMTHQMILVVSGNYSWLNWLTIVLGFLCLPDFATVAPGVSAPLWFQTIQIAVGVFAIILSIEPAKNLISRHQKMNYCWNRWHLIGAYGAFGSVTKKRYEIVLEGMNEKGEWKEYEFKGKPTSLTRTPPIVAPYHLRLDWLMWFLPFSVGVGSQGINVFGFDPWFIHFVAKLLDNDEATLKLIRSAPFPEKPMFIRAQFYHYQFTDKGESGVWKRKLLGEYLPSVSLSDLRQILA